LNRRKAVNKIGSKCFGIGPRAAIIVKVREKDEYY